MVKNFKPIKYRQIEPNPIITNKLDLEKLIYFLSSDEISALVLRHLGYRSDEIYKIIGLKNMSAYRKLCRGLNMRIYLFKNLYK